MVMYMFMLHSILCTNEQKSMLFKQYTSIHVSEPWHQAALVNCHAELQSAPIKALKAWDCALSSTGHAIWFRGALKDLQDWLASFAENSKRSALRFWVHLSLTLSVTYRKFFLATSSSRSAAVPYMRFFYTQPLVDWGLLCNCYQTMADVCVNAHHPVNKLAHMCDRLNYHAYCKLISLQYAWYLQRKMSTSSSCWMRGTNYCCSSVARHPWYASAFWTSYLILAPVLDCETSRCWDAHERRRRPSLLRREHFLPFPDSVTEVNS